MLKPGLRLRGTQRGWEQGLPVMQCRRQQHFNCRAATLLTSDAAEAGLTVYYQPEHHYEIFVTPEEVGLRKTIGDLSLVVTARPRPAGASVQLEIVADRDLYRFWVRSGEEGLQELGSARTQFVSTEATVCSFTGVMLGLYAVGGDAEFVWFEYKENVHKDKAE